MNAEELLRMRIAGKIENEGVQGWIWDNGNRSKKTVRCLPFRDYMEICLYDGQWGYYRSGDIRVGKSGDFYTSPFLGMVMGEKLAAFIGRLAESFGGGIDVAEWGAGTGRLSRQMADAWKRSGQLPLAEMTYTVVDMNPVHLSAARVEMEQVQHVFSGLQFMTPIEAEMVQWGPRPLVVAANELLDAFPVHRLVKVEGKLWELGAASVGLEPIADSGSTAAFQYAYMPLSDPLLAQSLACDDVELEEGQVFEVNLDAERWIAVMGALIGRGALVIADYGHEAAELQSPHRMNGTLRCYKNHIAHENPFDSVGEQDITAHVNFTAIMRAAGRTGWRVGYYDTQKRFLLDQGILDDLAAHDGSNPFGEEARRNRSIAQLLLGDGMSDIFKVLVLVKD
ncbi:class I SAM-dependent methyltransferase [Paenibacillus nasutitermitis]|uniref:SAM-dependent methyltransferase n=1 Tax=Paenibacillus nasutitermitis TaxID=1652958 RepID=A0A916Z299_9BACL|nr:SAM-dependent methyltransferase [Paenibacillus nasutitermitis]GGD71153.1 SAM-dependent methyltransferase [Paenibacillus nasutitermitis]